MILLAIQYSIKRNKPIAKLKPYIDESISIFGSFKGRGEIKSDITARIEEKWDSENE